MKFKPSYETEIYVSDVGYLCIKQITSYGEEALVLLSPDQTRKLSADIEFILNAQESWWTVDDGEGGK